MTVVTVKAAEEVGGARLGFGRMRGMWAGVAVGVWILAYAVWMGAMFVPALSEPDDNGYFAQGSLLAETGRTWFVGESDAQYVGMHWLLTP
ncbi:MAG TPA: hypothetical protein VFE58_18430, partial [Tepidisphaeraceae bacterium]|nr:hypothetical protein [Tepidisphaeraceae bacterium]